jgi:peptidoglycan/LPS O-acetylase OafA/YrhL
VISGFIMLRVSWRRFGKEGQAAKFLRDRAIRVLPLYWLLTLIYAAFAKESAPAVNIVKSLLFFPHLNATDGLPFPVLALGWTLNYEVLFYALVALGLLFATRAIGIAFVLCVLVLLTLAGSTLDGLGVAFTFWTSPIMLFFVAGMGVCFVQRRGTAPSILALVGAGGSCLAGDRSAHRGAPGRNGITMAARQHRHSRHWRRGNGHALSRPAWRPDRLVGRVSR